MININLGEAEIVFLSPGLRVFPAQSLTGGRAAPADVVGPGGRLPGEVVLHAGVLQLLPAPLVLHHAGELLLHAAHVGGVVDVGGAGDELAKEQVPLVYGLEEEGEREVTESSVLPPCRPACSTGRCWCTGWRSSAPSLGWTSSPCCTSPWTSPCSPWTARPLCECPGPRTSWRCTWTTSRQITTNTTSGISWPHYKYVHTLFRLSFTVLRLGTDTM